MPRKEARKEMEPKRSRKLSRPSSRPPPPTRRRAVWPVVLLVTLCFASLPLAFVLSGGRSAGLSEAWHRRIGAAVRRGDAAGGERAKSPGEPRDRLLGGLLSPGADETSCLSRYQSSLYRRQSPHSPSPYLAARLRKYEALHRKCGPGTLFYKKSLMQLTSAHSMGLTECNYLIWAPFSHLGDRMLSMASAFLYALLTDRVFLVDMADDMADLFCEPFPGASWALPPGFHVKNLTLLHRGSERSYGNLLRDKKVRNDDVGVRSESLPSHAYVHLEHDYQLLDQLFFCDDDQTVLRKVNWLILRSNLYFAPGLFLVPQFEDELRWMFPARDTVFHHLGRYLFHPSNTVWGLISRYYASYMAKFDEKVGLEITTFAHHPVSPEEYLKQITACARQEELLPDVDPNATTTTSSGSAGRSKALLVSSSESFYSERLKSVYYEHTTVTGEGVTVLQPSTERQSRNQKALAEVYLQSYCDAAVVSGWSTVGYVAHGLAGVRPWLLLPTKDRKAADPPCARAASMEPCFHAPPSYDCKAKKKADLGAVLRHVRHCEDVDDGLKLFD